LMARHHLSPIARLRNAAWFGGTLANAVALNPAAASARQSRARRCGCQCRLGPLDSGERRGDRCAPHWRARLAEARPRPDTRAAGHTEHGGDQGCPGRSLRWVTAYSRLLGQKVSTTPSTVSITGCIRRGRRFDGRRRGVLGTGGWSHVRTPMVVTNRQIDDARSAPQSSPNELDAEAG
jgi:hypothetical protein